MNLSQRCRTIEAQIAKIKASGRVADARTWISSYVVPKKSGKRYTYYRLMKADPKRSGGQMVQYLGSKNNKLYREMKQAIARRNQIQKLEKQLARLKKLEAQAPLTHFRVVEHLRIKLVEIIQQIQILDKQLELLTQQDFDVQSS